MADEPHYLHRVEVRNPHASQGLTLTFELYPTATAEEMKSYARRNSALDLEWLAMRQPHERPVVIVGGGPSIKDEIETIRAFAEAGAYVLAVNAASKFLSANGITVDAQFILDPQQATSTLVDRRAKDHLFASQVHPDTMDAVPRATVVHLLTEGIETCLPKDRLERGDFAVIGGGVSGGNSAICAAYALGYRNIHLFGLDSSHADDKSHAYPQPMNDHIPCVVTTWNGKDYKSSMPMKAQAERLVWLVRQLEAAGVKITPHGEGLAQAMLRSPPTPRSEREKYETIWQLDAYRKDSPAEESIEKIVNALPVGPVLDIGCGPGRAAVKLAELGYQPILLDIAHNCRDASSLSLPFHVCDFSDSIPVKAPAGYCCDVMEHIPPENVDKVLANISGAVDTCFFKIDMEPDGFGALIGEPLHLSIHDAAWWSAKLAQFWPVVEYHGGEIFVVKKEA